MIFNEQNAQRVIDTLSTNLKKFLTKLSKRLKAHGNKLQ